MTARSASGRRARLGIVLAAGLLTLLLGARPAAAQARGPRTVSAAATLSILRGGAERVTAGGGRQPGANGMILAEGDRIVTGGMGIAVITFLDGSTVTVQPGSDVVVRRAPASGDRASTRVFINAGAVWARVRRLADPGSGMSLESNTATAAVHDGLIGARQNRDGSFECWTQAGELAVTDRGGRALVALAPGQMTRVGPGGSAQPAPFAVMASTLRVVASRGVLPLLQMPYHTLLAGFVAPGVEVNQVYGSVTRAHPDGTRSVEVPAGFLGPYTLMVEGREETPFTITLVGLSRGSETHRVELCGRIGRGERQWTSVMQDMPTPESLTSGAGPEGARAQGVLAARLGPMRRPLPGEILLAPAEVEAAGR